MKFDESSKTLTINDEEDFEKTAEYASKTKKVVIGNGITEIPNEAFMNFKVLTEVKLGNVTEIGMDAFANCSALKTIDLSKVKVFENRSFSGCVSLTTINLRSVQVLSGDVFNDCTKLTKILNLSGVDSIYGDPFAGCTSLVEFYMPKRRVVDSLSFLRGCTGIKTIYMYKSTLTRSKVVDGISKEHFEAFFKRMVGHPVKIVVI